MRRPRSTQSFGDLNAHAVAHAHRAYVASLSKGAVAFSAISLLRFA
jgi:hypothetical protein